MTYPVLLKPSMTVALPWFAVRVKSNFERRCVEMFLGKGVEAFSPEYESRRRWSDRYKTVNFPLFPGYVFCRVDLNHRLPIITTPGFLYIVSAGNKPTPVDEAEIEGIQALVCSGLSTLPWPTLAVGQRVRLESGPLSGLEGTLIHVGTQNRICVSVTLLRRGVTVEVDREWVLPVSSTRIAKSDPETIPECKEPRIAASRPVTVQGRI